MKLVLTMCLQLRTILCGLCKEQYLTGGYIISLRGVNKLLEKYKDCFFSSDWMTTRLQYDNHSYSYFPWLIIQEGRDTSLRNSPDADHNKVVNLLNDIGYELDNYIME